MKRTNMTLMVIALIATLSTNSQASNRSLEGLVIGGGTGAIFGQAIGHTTQSTIIGATVGGTVGVLIGSRWGSHQREVRHHGRRVFSHSGAKYYPRRPQVYREVVHHYDRRSPVFGHRYKKNKRHHKIRPVFSNKYRQDCRPPGKKFRSNRPHNRF